MFDERRESIEEEVAHVSQPHRPSWREEAPLALARATLRQLGYSPKEAARAAEAVRRALEPDARPDLETLVRACLRACPLPARARG